MSLVKTYCSRYTMEAGKSVTAEAVTDEVVVDRIRTDPAFARAASQWLVELAKQASASLQGPVPSAPQSDRPIAGSSSASGSHTSSKTVANPAPVAVSPDRVLAQSDLTVRNLPKFLAQDQLAFWTLPLHSSVQSLAFWVPATFGTAALVGNDTAIEAKLPTSPTTVSRAANASTAGMLALLGVGGGLYMMGQAQHDDHQRETGFLVGEAAIDAYAASTAVQYTTQRERPFTGNNKGQFFYGGNSFPSNTAAVSWAAASVIAHEYPGTLTKLLVYGLAAGVSAGRVIGEKHWTSDAVIGSAMGWYMGTQVYRARSQGPEIDAANWGTFERAPREEGYDPAYMGSTYMPLDSWVYPAFERLAALGYLPTEIIAIRPWPSLECARLVQEAEEQIRDRGEENHSVESVVRTLRQEFAMELANLEGTRNLGVQLESAYARGDEIAGRALRDSYDNAQTLYDDFGRPYGRGFNAIAGGSVRAEAGPLAFYFRGEFQHGAALPNYTPQQALAIVQANPNEPPYLPLSSVPTFNAANQFRPIEAYVALNIANYQLSFGYQTYFWGPDDSTSLMFSNNAPTEPMLKIGRLVPYEPQGAFRWLGKVRNTAFVGALPNYYWVRGPYPQFPVYGSPYQTVSPLPYTWGDKLALKMTENLEIGVSLSVIWAGYGRPATLHTWLHTLNTNGNAQTNDPGKRYTGFNFSYRLPKLRDKVLFYADGMANDEPNPIAYFHQSAWYSGLYFPRLPMLPNLDLRVEGGYTNVPDFPNLGPYYQNDHYAQGYTNYWQIIGSWIGRQGDAIQAWSTYWFSPRNKLQIGYRRLWVDPIFLQGGNLNDFSTSVDWLFKHDLQLSSTLQYERWNFPLLSPTPVHNVSASLQLMFWPTHGTSSGRFDRVAH